MLFVGFSLNDDNFHKIMDAVRLAIPTVRSVFFFFFFFFAFEINFELKFVYSFICFVLMILVTLKLLVSVVYFISIRHHLHSPCSEAPTRAVEVSLL